MSDLITLVGTIVDHEGATPLAGARITATPSQRVTQTSDGEEALSDASATTDGTGAFTLPLVYAEGLRYTIVYRSGGERLMRGVLDCDAYAAGATVDVADLPPIAGVPPSAVETLQAWFLAQLEALGEGDASPEGIQDVVGAMIVAAGGTYDDEAGTITLPSSGGGGDVAIPAGAFLVLATDDEAVADANPEYVWLILETTPPPPVAPTGLVATGLSSTQVSLTWDAVAEVLGYEYRVGGGAAVDVGNVLTFVVTGLTAETSYDFEVRAYNAEGPGAWSTTASGSTLAEAAPVFVLEQQKNGPKGTTGAGSITVTLDVAPAEGNLLIAASMVAGSVTAPAGWSEAAISQDSSRSASIWYRVAGASESAASEWTVAGGRGYVNVSEWSGNAPTGVLDLANTYNAGAASVTTFDLDLPVASTVNALCIAVIANNTSAFDDPNPAFSDGFTKLDRLGFTLSLSSGAAAYKISEGPETFGTTVTWATPAAYFRASIASFKAAS